MCGDFALSATAGHRDDQIRCGQLPARPHEFHGRLGTGLKCQSHVLRESRGRVEHVVVELEIAVVTGEFPAKSEHIGMPPKVCYIRVIVGLSNVQLRNRLKHNQAPCRWLSFELPFVYAASVGLCRRP